MKNPFVVSFVLLLAIIYFSFYNLMPQTISSINKLESEFSTERALIPLKEISKVPHFIGTKENKRVRDFLTQSLKDLGLQPEIQQGYVLNEQRGRMNQPVNIIAKIKGSGEGKALLIFSHYDSALTPSFGASDAGSGVVTILESLRAYKASGKQPKNDIVILFTDAEEVGLDGAKLFVRSHPWAKNIGLALNFEARGSGGPSSMIVETNQGNKNIINEFIQANPEYPVASSLLYSVYKMLPNDTDSTVLREEGDIDGLFFAFIDDHFDYHTAGDNFDRMDRNSLEHQGSYLMPLLHYFADSDLSKVKSEEDYVYTNFPLLKMIAYPFHWVMPSIFIATILFIVFLFFGFKMGKLDLKSVLNGAIPFILAVFGALLIGVFGWSSLLKIYPQYQEILHGFTYNGHSYIAFFVSLTVGITWYVYFLFQKGITTANLLVSPLIIWLVINILLAIYLKGAAYFIIPFYCALLSFGLFLKSNKTSVLLHLALASPAVFLFSPLIQTFPIGLGLKTMVISTVFTVLLFGLLLPFLSMYSFKKQLAQGFLLLAVIFFVQAHLTSDFNEDRKKPNSLLYFQDLDVRKAYWLTYDTLLDDWTSPYIGTEPQSASSIITSAAQSKYNSGYTYAADAPIKFIPYYQVNTIQDTVVGNHRSVTFRLLPEKKANVLKLSVDQDVTFSNLAFNGVAVKENLSYSKSNNQLLTFYVTELDTLEVSYTIAKDLNPSFTLLEYSFDLMDNPWVEINPRSNDMMPKPFVFNDALVVKQKITPQKNALE